MQVLFEIMVQIKQKRGIGVENTSPRSFSGGAGKQIPKNYFTYRPIQIFKILFQGSYTPKSDSPHKITRYCLYYTTSLAYSFPPDTNVLDGIYLYQRGYHSQEASQRGQPLNIFTWFIGSGSVLPGTRESPKCERGYFLLRGFSFFFFEKTRYPRPRYHIIIHDPHQFFWLFLKGATLPHI